MKSSVQAQFYENPGLWHYLLLLVALSALPVAATDDVQPGAFRLDPPTLHSLGLRWYIDGDDDGDATCRMRYRQVGEQAWLEALPLLRVNREEVDRDFEQYGRRSGRYQVGNLLAGSILFLTPDTEYEMEVELSDPDGGAARRNERVRTQAVPRAPAPERVLHLYVEGHKGAVEEPSFTEAAQAFAALRPGDLLLVHAGQHAGGAELRVSGTQAAPIQIRGVGAATLEIADTAWANLLLDDRQHIFVEGLTLRGGRFGILARKSSYLTVRHCAIEQARYGIYNDSEASRGWYLADNVLTGIDAHWQPREQEDAAETGIVVYGRGHVVEYNRIERFWDGLTIADYGRPPDLLEGIDLHCVAIDFNNNDIRGSRDDLLEVDFASHNIRVFDNRLYDAQTGVSTQPLYGGPVYFVGNVIYGVVGSVYKFHNWPAGIYVFHNTSVGRNMAFASAPLWQNAMLRNNLLLGAGTGYTMESGSPDPRTSLDYNGWSRNNDDPQAFIKFTDDGTLTGALHYRSGSLPDFYEKTGHGEHSMVVDMDVFVAAHYPETGVSYDSGSMDLRLRPGSAPVDAGVRLPNITRQVAGAAPDMGAYEVGVGQPHFGPRPRVVETVVEEYAAGQPGTLTLAQNVPNPFNGETVIRFALPADAAVTLTLYNMAGQEVARLVQGWRRAGEYALR